MIERIGAVLFGMDDFVATFVAARLNMQQPFQNYGCLGVARGDKFVGGVVYHGLRSYPAGNMIDVSFAFDDARWALRRETIRTMCRYPFIQLDCVRVNAIIAKSNTRSRHAAEVFGFRREGSHRLGWEGRETAISYGIMRDECRWLKEEPRKAQAA